MHVGGYVVENQNITLITIIGAGHLFPTLMLFSFITMESSLPLVKVREKIRRLLQILDDLLSDAFRIAVISLNKPEIWKCNQIHAPMGHD